MMLRKLSIGAVAALLALGFAPIAFGTTGTGTLGMYSDSSCTTLLPQVTVGNHGYILPSTGTTVYIKVTGITETPVTTVELLYNGTISYTEFLSVTVTDGATNCVPWVVGTFSQATGVTINSCTTGIVKYGDSSGPGADKYTTLSNGGSDGGHFYGASTPSNASCSSTTTTTTTTGTGGCPPEGCPPPVPEFPLGFLVVFALALPALLLIAMRAKVGKAPVARLLRRVTSQR